MNSGFKGIFWSWLPSMFTRKKKANIFKMCRKMLQCKVIFIFKSCAGFEVSNGPEDFLVFTEPSRKNRQRRQHFLAVKPNNWCAGFPAKFVLTSDIILSLNNYKNHRLPKTPIFSGYWLSKCSQGAIVTRMVLSLTVLKWISLLKFSEIRPIHFIFETVISIVCCGSCRWSNSF